MQLILTENDLHLAIEERVRKLGLNLDGLSVETTIKATRNPQGYTAIVDINEAGTVAESSTQQVIEPSPQPLILPEETSDENPAYDAEPEAEPEEAVATGTDSLFPQST